MSVEWRVPLVEIDVPEEDVTAVLDCLRSGWLTMGPRIAAFERAFAEWNEAPFAIAAASGTAALHLALIGAGVGPGDEVIVPAHSFVACAHAPRYCGATPVLCDSLGGGDANLSPASVEAAITPRTRAVLAVHMWGYPARTEELAAICEGHGIALIEDCCEAIGARLGDGRRAGSAGNIGAFSFFSKKQLAVGEGGAVTTADEAVAERLRSVRSHAMSSLTWERHTGHALGYDVTEVGFNYRLDEPRAALALSRLMRLNADIEARRAVASAYRERLAGAAGLELLFDDEATERGSHFAFALLAPDRERRDAIRAALQERGVQTTWYPAIHRLGEYSALGTDAELPQASEIADRHFTLPLFAGLEEERIELVCTEARAVAASGP